MAFFSNFLRFLRSFFILRLFAIFSDSTASYSAAVCSVLMAALLKFYAAVFKIVVVNYYYDSVSPAAMALRAEVAALGLTEIVEEV